MRHDALKRSTADKNNYLCGVQITEDTLKELEFSDLLEQIVPHAYSEKVKMQIKQLLPMPFEKAKISLIKTSEYLASFENQNPIPFQPYDDIETELKVMTIEDYQLSAESFLKIRDLSMIVGRAVVYFRKFHDYYPTLFQQTEKIKLTKDIILKINTVFTKYGEIKSSASENLELIRIEMAQARKKTQEAFNHSLVKYSDLLDDIHETVIDDQRVLAVKSGFKKRIKGRNLGESSTGSITYIMPENVLAHYQRLRDLQENEKKEISLILKKLTAEIAVFQPLLKTYQDYVFDLDFTQAKAHFADQIHAILPKLNVEPHLKLVEAYHPLLWLKNKENGKETFSQTLELNEKDRIICISGPNAGGKSITLKTVGLLQLMIQSGILVPVNEKSEMFFFEQIKTDIGDNQSIENQLSTYSSRLKKMSKIIRVADEKTLLLIDEFGTGSDPELGGALAEAFLEYFYEKKSFAVITTHYTNIKVRIEELPHAKNAAMLFNEKTLEPLYHLEIGQAGSSFTFEVAEKNKIPWFIIKNAKKKVEHDVVNLDKTIVKLQQEKYNVAKLRSDLSETKQSVEDKRDNLKKLNDQLEQKLFGFQKLYEDDRQKLQFGERFDHFIESYANGRTKKDIIKEFAKVLDQERLRRKKTDKTANEKLKVVRRKVTQQLQKETVKNKIAETHEKLEQEQKKERSLWLKVGGRARIKGSSSVGTIEKIEKNEKVTLNYGTFKTVIKAEELERV